MLNVNVKVVCHYLKKPGDAQFITFGVLGTTRGSKQHAFGDTISADNWKNDFDEALRTTRILQCMRLTSSEASSHSMLEKFIPFHGSPADLITEAVSRVTQLLQVP